GRDRPGAPADAVRRIEAGRRGVRAGLRRDVRPRGLLPPVLERVRPVFPPQEERRRRVASRGAPRRRDHDPRRRSADARLRVCRGPGGRRRRGARRRRGRDRRRGLPGRDCRRDDRQSARRGAGSGGRAAARDPPRGRAARRHPAQRQPDRQGRPGPRLPAGGVARRRAAADGAGARAGFANALVWSAVVGGFAVVLSGLLYGLPTDVRPRGPLAVVVPNLSAAQFTYAALAIPGEMFFSIGLIALLGRQRVAAYSAIRILRRLLVLVLVVGVAAIARLSLDVALIVNLVTLIVTAIALAGVAIRDGTAA